LEKTGTINNQEIPIPSFPKFAFQPDWLARNALPEAWLALLNPPAIASYVKGLDLLFRHAPALYYNAL
jgi:hypothetical protein